MPKTMTGMMECCKCFHRWNVAIGPTKDEEEYQEILDNLSVCGECYSNTGHIVSKGIATNKELKAKCR